MSLNHGSIRVTLMFVGVGAGLLLSSCGSPVHVPDRSELGVVELDDAHPPCTLPPGEQPPAETDLEVDTVASGLTVPWDVAFADDGRAFVTERPGRIRVIEPSGELDPQPWARLDVYAEGEVGLMGIDVRRDSSGVLEVYVAPTHRRVPSGVIERLARGFARRAVRAVDPERGHPKTLQVLRIREMDGRATEPEVVVDDLPAFMLHSGGRCGSVPTGCST